MRVGDKAEKFIVTLQLKNKLFGTITGSSEKKAGPSTGKGFSIGVGN